MYLKDNLNPTKFSKLSRTLPFCHLETGVLKKKFKKVMLMEVTSAVTGLEGMIHHNLELGGILKIFLSNTFNLLDEFTEFKEKTGNFPGSPAAKNLPCNGWDTGLIFGQGLRSHMPTKQPLSSCALEPTCYK